MNNIKINFSIKDLENLSGIKAHTIRIWEKRYNLLQPNRTDTNIRNYSLSSLQKLLNISYLNNNGVKISKIANLTEDEIQSKVKKMASNFNIEYHAISSLKMAMINFNPTLFNNTYHQLIETKSFSDVFYSVFLPLLNHIGLLWQTNTITPAHEHFVSTLIKQKILIHIESLPLVENNASNKTFVLFLPENEIHDIGLLFIHYQLRSKGYHSIFLGESVPMESLKDLLTFFDDITFISYFTVAPEIDDVSSYIFKFNDLFLQHQHTKLYLLGTKLATLGDTSLPKKVTIFNSIQNLVKDL
jgi:DNA-binding transcriptional MerR regulator